MAEFQPYLFDAILNKESGDNIINYTNELTVNYINPDGKTPLSLALINNLDLGLILNFCPYINTDLNNKILSQSDNSGNTWQYYFTSYNSPDLYDRTEVYLYISFLDSGENIFGFLKINNFPDYSKKISELINNLPEYKKNILINNLANLDRISNISQPIA